MSGACLRMGPLTCGLIYFCIIWRLIMEEFALNQHLVSMPGK
jgi:hypothetical protein